MGSYSWGGSEVTPPQQHTNQLTKKQSAIMERHSTDMVPLGRDGFFKDPFFSSTWEEFDQERTHRMNESQNNFWDKVESDMAEFEASVAAMEADLDQRMAPHKPGLPDWALPPAQHKNWPKITSEDSSSSSGLMCPGLTTSRDPPPRL